MTTISGSGIYYDPYDLDIHADPYPVFRRLREQAPLYYNDDHDFYAISRFDDVEKGRLATTSPSATAFTSAWVPPSPGSMGASPSTRSWTGSRTGRSTQTTPGWTRQPFAAGQPSPSLPRDRLGASIFEKNRGIQAGWPGVRFWTAWKPSCGPWSAQIAVSGSSTSPW